MAKVDPVTAYTSGVIISTNTAYGGANKVTIPFRADKVTVSVVAGSGNPNLFLSVDGATDIAVVHGDKASQAGTYTFSLQEIDVLHYRQSGTDCHFVVNAERKAWRNMF